MSIEYNALFLSGDNLMVWEVDTFLASQYVFSNDAPALFYGNWVWVNSYSLLFPFGIFYRLNVLWYIWQIKEIEHQFGISRNAT